MEGPGLHDAAAAFRPGTLEADAGVDAGARNLLVNCAGVRAGHRVLVIHEDPALGWYDAAAPQAVARMAQAMGARVATIAVGGPEDGVPPELAAAQAAADVEIFFARIGDQDRFCDSRAGRISVVSYARTAAVLGSGYGVRDHGAMLALKARMNAALAGAGLIRVTCPLGTELLGRPGPQAETTDVTIHRFPMCVPAPVAAAGFSGRVALDRYLTPTGSRSYAPASLALPEVIWGPCRGRAHRRVRGRGLAGGPGARALRACRGYVRDRPGCGAFLACRPA